MKGIEFQERGSPHVRSFIWILNASNIQNEAAYIKFIEQAITVPLADPLNDPELFELITKFMLTPKLAGDTTRMNATFPMVDILVRKLLLQNHLILNLPMTKSKRFYHGEKHY